MTTKEERTKYLPTPEQIRLAAAKIREGWSPEEHMRRLTWTYDSQYDWNHAEPDKQVA